MEIFLYSQATIHQEVVLEASTILEKREGFIATLTINRPEKRNALDTASLKQLAERLGSLKSDKTVRAVILRGAGEQAFCSGVQLGSDRGATSVLQQVKDNIVSCPYPVIAMIYGFVLGAGCDLAIHCDFRLAADNAIMGINPVKLGWTYEYNSIYYFIKHIGAANTKELFLTGKFFDAHRVKEMGLVNYVYPVSELASAAKAFTEGLAENAPLAMEGTKFIINRLLQYPEVAPADQSAMRDIDQKLHQSEDAKEGRLAFSEKRKPVFQGR